MLLSLSLGALVWIADTLMDYLTFYRGEGTFIELLILAPPPHELYIRTLIMIVFLLFGGIIAGFVRHQQTIENAIANEEAELRATLYSIGDAVIATDLHGNIVRMNPIAEKLTGWNEAEGIGLPLDTVFQIINEETREKAESPTAQVLEKGVIIGLANHTLLVSKDGRKIPIADAGAPILDQDQLITGVVLVFRDQTEERQTQLLMQYHLELIEYSTDHSFEELLTYALKLTEQLTNSEIAFFKQISPEDTLPLYQYFAPSVPPFTFNSTDPDISSYPTSTPQMETCIQSKQAVIHPAGNTSPSQKGLIHSELIVPVVRKDQVVAVLGIGNKPGGYSQKDKEVSSFLADVLWETQQKKITREKIQISEENYRLMFQNILNGFALHKIILDDDGNPVDYIFLEVNQAFEELTGLNRGNILGKKVTAVLPGIENDPANWISRYGEVAATSTEIQFEQYAQNLNRWYTVTAYSPKPGYFATIFQDVTNQKLATEELEESQRQLSTLMDNLPGMVYRCKNDLDWTMEFVSQGCEKLTGYAPAEIVGNSITSYNKIIHPEDRQMVRDTVQAAVNLKQSFQITYRIIPPDGKIKWVWEQGQAVIGTDGEVVALEGFITDTTEQKLAEEALQNQAMMMENVSDAVIISDLDLVIQRWNKAAEDMLGWKEVEVIGMRMDEVSLPKFPVLTFQQVWEDFQKKGLWKGEAIQTTKDGTTINILSTASVAKDTQGNPIGIITINRDITELKKHQEILNTQREKLSALAQEVLTTQENERMHLSRDLHDTLGQALAVHKIYINILEQKLQQTSPELMPDLEKIIQSVDKASQISRSLSHSLRPPDLDSLGLEVALRNLCNQTAHVNGKKIEFQSNLGEDFHSEADITLYRVSQEALNNVLKHSEANEIIFSCIVEEDIITLKIIDNGIGFDPRILETHQGGLGIIGMSERMEHIGGSFEIQSSPQKGTTITARYPIQQKMAG